MSFERPYEGLRVIDMSQGLAGPYCGMLLAQNGADVIKIEPKGGDWARLIGGVYGDHTAYSIVANLGKRSMVVDLKHEASHDIVSKMVADADVFIEGYRPGVAERLGYSYPALSASNPKLIYVSISGFGQSGPMSKQPAMDPMLQAFSGFVSENTGGDGAPHHTPVSFFDMSAGLYAQQAVAAALFASRDHGKGRKIEVSLMEAAAGVQAVRLLSGYREGPRRSSTAPSGTFSTQDGFIQINIVRDHEFAALCELLGLSDLAQEEKFKSIAGRLGEREYLNSRVNAVTVKNTTHHWLSILTEAGLQNQAVQSYREFVGHPQAETQEVFAKLHQPGIDDPWPVPNIPGMPRLEDGDVFAQSPTVGEHTREIMMDFGYPAETIEALFNDGVLQ